MKKKLSVLLLALTLALSLLTTALAAPLPPKDPEPDPTPIVTIQPGDPKGPGISPNSMWSEDDPPDLGDKGAKG